MKKNFTIRNAVNTTVSSMKTAHKTKSSINFVRTNVLTLFLLFCFWQTGMGQPTANDRLQLFGQTGTLGEPPALEQNEPNPFTQETIIRYFLPEGTVNAKIEVRNTESKVVGAFLISYPGHGNIILSAGTLAAGSYFYSLIINGKTIDTKKMVLLD